MSEIKILSIIDGKKLLSLEVEPPKFIVSRFFPTRLYILAGSPKISMVDSSAPSLSVFQRLRLADTLGQPASLNVLHFP